jgi:hypothetical protein
MLKPLEIQGFLFPPHNPETPVKIQHCHDSRVCAIRKSILFVAQINHESSKSNAKSAANTAFLRLRWRFSQLWVKRPWVQVPPLGPRKLPGYAGSDSLSEIMTKNSF